MFGVRSYGECWSGSNTACTYNKYGRAYDCINEKKWICSDSSSQLCASPHSKSIYAFVLSDSKYGTTCGTKPSNKPTPRVTKIPTQPNVTPKITPRVTPRITLKTTLKIVTTPKPTPKVTIPKGPPVIKCGNIEYKLTKLGCWNELGDTRPPRAMPELLFTSRDRNSHTYVGYDFDNHNYGVFLER